MEKEVKKSAKEVKKEVPKEISKVQKPAPEGKCAKLRALLASGEKTFTVAQMMKASGFDERNVRTAMSILRNPKRTKETIEAEYDRGKKTYTLSK